MAGKKKAAASSKKAKPSVKRAENPGDPEWEHLEERFSTLSSDFGQLVEMMDRDKEEEPDR